MKSVLAGIRADRSYSYRALEKTARSVRNYLNLSPEVPVDALQLFENLDQIRIKVSDESIIPLRERVDLLENEGYTRYDDERKIIEVVASDRTYRGLENGLARAAYFIAHELGHCVLHTAQLVRLAQLPTIEQQAAFHRGGRAEHKPYQDTEWQANAFASALLMPAAGIRLLEDDYPATPSRIAMQFHVSLEAAGYRLELYQQRRSELLD
jgi:Zn-dependent peptidase ImmA (M78 family)